MTAAAAPSGTGTDPSLADAARYLAPNATTSGGRNARPLAIPVLLTTYCGAARTRTGAAVALLGATGGGGLWLGLSQLGQPEPSIVLALVGLVLAAGALTAGAALGLRLLRGGRALVTGLRRWHAVAPEVPVRGIETLTSGAGAARIVLAGTGAVVGLAGVVLGVTAGGLPLLVGAGVAGASFVAVGVVAALGWFRVRGLLQGAAPQTGQESFAPAPYAYPTQQPQPWMPQPPQQPAPWMPAPSGAQPAQPAQAPWAPAGQKPAWAPPEAVEPEMVPSAPAVAEPDLGDTRLVADTTMSGRKRTLVVLLEDGRRLEPGITLIGRDPQPRPEDPATATTITVLQPTVSKTHATMRVTAETVHVTDRASTNGTTVIEESGARRRLEPWVESPVDAGSQVLVGSFRVRVLAQD